MKKGATAILIIPITILGLLFFTACDKFKITNIRANSHFKTANDNYSQEKYKKAVDEYLEALKINPELKIANLYLGVAYSSLYRAGLPDPSQDEQFKNNQTQMGELKQEIEDIGIFIQEFEKNKQVMNLIEQRDSKLLELRKAEDNLNNTQGYREYRNRAGELMRSEKTFESNETFMNKLAQKNQKDITLEESTQLEDKKMENEELTQKIEQLKGDIVNFEKNEQYLANKKIVQDLETEVNSMEENLKQQEGYVEYSQKLKDSADLERKLRAMESYNNKLSDNVMYGANAIKYLKIAREEFPENDKIVNALGDIYDKMENYEEAQKYYLMVLEKNNKDPKAYYTLANFYAKYQKFEEAQKMYEDRIALDPKDPSGYLFYANYLQNRGKWDQSILTHEKRLATLLDPELLALYSELDKLDKDIVDMGKKQQYMDNIKKNKSIDKKTKDQLINAKLKEIEELGLKPVDQLKKEMAAKKKEIDTLQEKAESNLTELPDEKKAELAEAYYRIGYVYWAKSYQTQADYMDNAERTRVINGGLKAMDKALQMDPEFPNPYSYKGLLWREMIKVNPNNRGEYIRKNEEFNATFIRLWKKRQQRLDYQRQLQDMEGE